MMRPLNEREIRHISRIVQQEVNPVMMNPKYCRRSHLAAQRKAEARIAKYHKYLISKDKKREDCSVH